jgi:hypothetical protein
MATPKRVTDCKWNSDAQEGHMGKCLRHAPKVFQGVYANELALSSEFPDALCPCGDYEKREIDLAAIGKEAMQEFDRGGPPAFKRVWEKYGLLYEDLEDVAV